MKSNRLNEKDIKKERKEIVSFTLPKATIKFIREEAQRLSLSGSMLVNSIISNYSVLPLIEEENKKQEEKKNKSK